MTIFDIPPKGLADEADSGFRVSAEGTRLSGLGDMVSHAPFGAGESNVRGLLEGLPRDSRTHLRAIIDALPGFIAYIDANERYVYVSSTSKDWYGVEPDAVIGMTVRELIGEKRYAACERYYAHALIAGQPASFENVVDCRGRPVRHILARLVPHRDARGRIIGCHAPSTDITAIKEAERERERLLAERQAILDTMEPGVSIVAKDGTVAYRNGAARRILGLDRAGAPGEAEPVPPRPSQKWHLDGRPFAPEDYPGARALGGETVSGLEARLRRASDGAVIIGRYDAVPLRNREGEIISAIVTFEDATAEKRELEHHRLLTAELDHRLKNLFVVVKVIAEQSLAGGYSGSEAFAVRLRALADSQDLLRQSEWEGAELRRIVTAAVAPYAGEHVASRQERVLLQGPEVKLPARTTQLLHLVFHELATNAAKYGALSAPEGSVEVRWDLRTEGKSATKLHLVWRERGGPRARPPRQPGFGTRLIERSIPYELDGNVELQFRPEGLVCEMAVPTTLPEERKGEGPAS